MTDDLLSLYSFNRWADERIYAACRKLSEADYKREVVPGWSSVHATVYHIAGGTHLWARRFDHEVVTSLPTEAELPTLDDAWAMLDQAQRRIETIISSSTIADLTSLRSFTNLKGETRSMPFWAALRHVVNHATYHRGQIASKLKLLGVDPPTTDMAAWAYDLTEEELAQTPNG